MGRVGNRNRNDVDTCEFHESSTSSNVNGTPGDRVPEHNAFEVSSRPTLLGGRTDPIAEPSPGTRLAISSAMNPSSLVLPPSGHPTLNPPTTYANATASSPDAAAGDQSSFADALKANDPQPTRQSSAPKTTDREQTGGGLPGTGKRSPPSPATVAHAGTHSAAMHSPPARRSGSTSGDGSDKSISDPGTDASDASGANPSPAVDGTQAVDPAVMAAAASGSGVGNPGTPAAAGAGIGAGAVAGAGAGTLSAAGVAGRASGTVAGIGSGSVGSVGAGAAGPMGMADPVDVAASGAAGPTSAAGLPGSARWSRCDSGPRPRGRRCRAEFGSGHRGMRPLARLLWRTQTRPARLRRPPPRHLGRFRRHRPRPAKAP